MATNPVPNIPFKVQVTDTLGYIHPTWGAWFREVLVRVGGNVAPTNTELAGDTEAVSEAIVILQAEITSLNSQISALEAGLDQGRAL